MVESFSVWKNRLFPELKFRTQCLAAQNATVPMQVDVDVMDVFANMYPEEYEMFIGESKLEETPSFDLDILEFSVQEDTVVVGIKAGNLSTSANPR